MITHRTPRRDERSAHSVPVRPAGLKMELDWHKGDIRGAQQRTALFFLIATSAWRRLNNYRGNNIRQRLRSSKTLGSGDCHASLSGKLGSILGAARERTAGDEGPRRAEGHGTRVVAAEIRAGIHLAQIPAYPGAAWVSPTPVSLTTPTMCPSSPCCERMINSRNLRRLQDL